jgi:hypothetical protein
MINNTQENKMANANNVIYAFLALHPDATNFGTTAINITDCDNYTEFSDRWADDATEAAKEEFGYDDPVYTNDRCKAIKNKTANKIGEDITAVIDLTFDAYVKLVSDYAKA